MKRVAEITYKYNLQQILEIEHILYNEIVVNMSLFVLTTLSTSALMHYLMHNCE